MRWRRWWSWATARGRVSLRSHARRATPRKGPVRPWSRQRKTPPATPLLLPTPHLGVSAPAGGCRTSRRSTAYEPSPSCSSSACTRGTRCCPGAASASPSSSRCPASSSPPCSWARSATTGSSPSRTSTCGRVLRLFPALVVFVGIVYLYSRCHRAGRGTHRSGGAGRASLLRQLGTAMGAKLGVLGHTWSLAVEEQFYLIWPVILWLGYRLARAWGVFAVAVDRRARVDGDQARSSPPTPVRPMARSRTASTPSRSPSSSGAPPRPRCSSAGSRGGCSSGRSPS